MKDSPVILKDVSLCAIVRDEMLNSAGGIEDFVRSTLPFVASAVIIDTGSKDGTWEKLQELRGEYPHPEVFQRQFRDFASSRNFALSKVKTELVLVLDADERLFGEDFRELARLIGPMKHQKRKIGINSFFGGFIRGKTKITVAEVIIPGCSGSCLVSILKTGACVLRNICIFAILKCANSTIFVLTARWKSNIFVLPLKPCERRTKFGIGWSTKEGVQE